MIYTLLLLVTVLGFSYLTFIFLGFLEKNPNYVITIILTVFMILVATSLKILKDNVSQRFLLQEIKAKQMQTELNLLKAQINPHFLFNTLNNLYGLARKQEKAVADGIAHLSHLMRYMIYESEVDEIHLEKEIQQIERIIDLQKLRFSKEDNITIDFEMEGNVKSIRIPPMLLIPFVENAFKHGISLKFPSFIRIKIKSSANNAMYFSIRNSIHKQINVNGDKNSGMGLHNVKRRLELLFPEQHELLVRRSENEFFVELIIKDIARKQNEMPFNR
ncbi:MAG: histidine kinase [Candidatus Aminicenantes bacterium]|nr:histidine kinase [Candidatus Aminicenantes bacterium]